MADDDWEDYGEEFINAYRTTYRAAQDHEEYNPFVPDVSPDDSDIFQGAYLGYQDGWDGDEPMIPLEDEDEEEDDEVQFNVPVVDPFEIQQYQISQQLLENLENNADKNPPPAA